MIVFFRKFIFGFVLLFILFLDVDKCLAEENYIKAMVTNNEDKVVLELFVEDREELYGFLARINYDKEELNLIDCKSDNYNVSFDNNMLLAESVNGYKNANIAICEFEIINKDNDFSFEIVDISLSDSIRVIYNENIFLSYKMDYLSGIEENTYLNFSNEVVSSTNMVKYNNFSDIFLISVVIWFMIVAGCIVCMKYKLIFIIIFVSFVSFPINVLGKSNLFYVTDIQFDDIKDILLKNKDSTYSESYDYDEDGIVTINDLVIAGIDVNKKYRISLSENNLTNKDIVINFVSNIDNFSYIVVPDNSIVYNNFVDFVVKENGEYKFIVYDIDNNSTDYIVEITNIDKKEPKISYCDAVISGDKTIVSFKSYDKDVAKFMIGDDIVLSANKGEYTIDKVVKSVKVIAYDKVDNKSVVTCNSYYEQIKPSNNSNVVYNETTATLKVWIEHTDRVGDRTSFYTSHIWVRDPYKQFKLQIPDNFGEDLVVANDLLNNAIKQNDFQNKLIVAVNGSGFAKKGVWWDNFIEANASFDKTSLSPLVLVNGVVMRDLSHSKLPISTHPVYGLNKNGDLVYYNYLGGSEHYEYNKRITKQIIEAGILNTFSFKPVLVENGKLKVTTSEENIRQAICQIDKNNFVFITDVFVEPRTGFSFKELGNYMISLGCKTGFNIDGGGSTSLLLKRANENSFAITGNSRKIADIIYFHE